MSIQKGNATSLTDSGMARRWLVVGGGFRGIICAFLLASKGKDVILIERSTDLGAVLSSVKWKGFYLDKGCHMFDNDSDITTSVVMDILEGDVEPVSVRDASITNRIKTDGIAIPNLATYGEEAARDILYEVVAASAKPYRPCQTLQERLADRFGPTAGRYLADAAWKMYRIETGKLEADSFWLTPFRRIKFLDDSAADILKQSPILDERIASSSQADPMRFYRDHAGAYPFRYFYPKEHGMRGFCEKAQERLRRLGVSLLLGHDIERLNINAREAKITLSNGQEVAGDRVLWATGIETLGRSLGFNDAIAGYVHQVPMIFYYFVIEKESEGQYSYVQNFDREDLFFRVSVPGGYVPNTCPAGLSYVCCEVPTTIDNPEWNRPEQFVTKVWEELQRYDIVRCRQPVETLTVKIPASYRVPKIGFSAALKEMTEYLKESSVVCPDQWDFSKNDILRSLQKLVENV